MFYAVGAAVPAIGLLAKSISRCFNSVLPDEMLNVSGDKSTSAEELDW